MTKTLRVYKHNDLTRGGPGFATARDKEVGSYDPNNLHPMDTYTGLYAAYHFFNTALFDRKLPTCLITIQRHKGAYGYFSGCRFGSTSDPTEIRDEIALNPQHFSGRSARETLSTLVHEMTHLAQHHFGKPGRGGYHNRQWVQIMHAVGLVPSDTGRPGGAETGDRVSHYILEGGPFDRACACFLEQNAALLYQDRAYSGDEATRRKRLKKAASKTKFSCIRCGEEHAWAKPSARLVCGRCGARLEADSDSFVDLYAPVPPRPGGTSSPAGETGPELMSR